MTRRMLALLGVFIALLAATQLAATAPLQKMDAAFQFNGQPLRSGPHHGYNIVTHAKWDDDAKVLAQSSDGNWLFVWSDSGDGWAPRTTVTLDGDYASLAIWSTPMRDYSFKPWASIERPTDLKMGFSAGYQTMTCIPPLQAVKLLAQSPDGHWVFVWSDMGDGWVPRSAISSDADLSYLKIWHAPINGAALAR